MRQIMRESERRGRLAVRAIDEDERGLAVRERKTPELLGVENPAVVAHHHAAHPDQHAHLVGLTAEVAQRSLPRPASGPRSEESRVGQEWSRTCSSQWAPLHSTNI